MSHPRRTVDEVAIGHRATVGRRQHRLQRCCPIAGKSAVEILHLLTSSHVGAGQCLSLNFIDPYANRQHKRQMPIRFFPRAGQVFVCDFSSFVEPEMTKKRPVIVISPRLPHRSQIVTVVPISTTAPKHSLPFVVRLSRNYHPTEPSDLTTWAKCDMLTNLSIERLDAFKVGRRKYEYPTVTQDDLLAVREGVIHGLGMSHLLKKQDSPT